MAKKKTETTETVETKAAETVKADEKAEKQYLRVNAPNGLNLRQGPDGAGAILAVLRDREVVENLDPKICPEGWRYVKTNDGLVGWVMETYVAEDTENG